MGYNKIIILFFCLLLAISCTTERPDATVEKRNHTSAAGTTDDAFKGDLLDLSDFESTRSVDGEHVRGLISQQNLKKYHNSEPIGNAKITRDSEESGNGTSFGGKQPLYVVDGIPVDGTRKASAGKWGDAEYTTAVDIASLEKESVEILSPEKAVELYGESGINGAVLITTKSGKKRDISYIRSSGDTTYTREDAASMGMMELIKGQKNKKENN